MAGSYKDGTWAQWVGVLGDQAEHAFERWANAQGLKFERMGWNRPACSMTKWPAALRSLPDYAVHNRCIEVIGHGRDGVLKTPLPTKPWVTTSGPRLRDPWRFWRAQ